MKNDTQKGARKERLSTKAKKKSVLLALGKHRGIIVRALREAEVPSRTYYDWLKADPDFADAVDNVGEERLDNAEDKLDQLINGYTVPDERIVMVTETTTTIGEDGKKVVRKVQRPELVKMTKVIGPNPSSVEFFLETKGKRRGYDKKVNVKVSGLGKLKVVKASTKPLARPEESTLKVTKAQRAKK